MVDSFSSLNRSTQHLLRNEYVLKDKSLVTSAWMVRLLNDYVVTLAVLTRLLVSFPKNLRCELVTLASLAAIWIVNP